MKKITTTKKEKDFYNIETIIDDIALISSSISGKNGLLNIKTNELIGELDYYNMFYDTDNKYYRQVRTEVRSSGYEYFLNVYDVFNHNYVVKDYNIVKSFENYGYVSLIKEKEDSDKLHFLDMYNLRDEDNIFNLEIDNAEVLLNHYGKIYFVLSKDNIKALYKRGRGLVTDFEYDDIKRKNGITFFYKNNKVRFSKDGEYDSISKEFNEISFHGVDNSLLYCKDDIDTYIYLISSNNIKLIRKTNNISKLVASFFYDKENESTEYLFIEEDENNRKSLISSIVYKNREKIETSVLASDCDEITINNGYEYQQKFQFYLEKDGKKELFLYDSHNSKKIGNYDNIEYFHDDIYALTNGCSTDIVNITLDKDPRTIIKNCHIIDDNYQGIIFSQKTVLNNELLGMYYFDENNYYNNIIKATHDSFKPHGKYLYEVEDNKKKGMYFLGKLIIPIEYEDITLSYSPEYKNIDDANYIYYALRKDNNSILAKRKNYHYKDLDESSKLEVLGEYKEILFFKDIIVVKTLLNIFIYDYNDKLLGKFPFDTPVTSFEVPEDKYNNKTIYCINNNYYFYKEGNLEKYYKEYIDMYLTTYETDTELFEASSYKKDILDSFTSYIDSMEDDLGETSLKELSNNKRKLEDKYPSLVLRKVKKREVK